MSKAAGPYTILGCLLKSIDVINNKNTFFGKAQVTQLKQLTIYLSSCEIIIIIIKFTYKAISKHCYKVFEWLNRD